MKFALFSGCTVQTEQYGYELSARAVLPRFGVELVDLKGAGCCGFLSSRVSSPLTAKYLTTRNMALAEKLGLDILALCNSCHLSFSEVKRHLERDEDLRNVINSALAVEGLKYSGESEVYHILEVLHDMVGVDKIADAVIRPLKNLKLAAHPGCHIFRPTDLKRPDDGEDPKKLDELIRALGAKAPDYPEKLDCCGSSIYAAQEKASLLIAGSKLKAVRDHGFDGLVTVCPLCFKIFDGKQSAMRGLIGDETLDVPVFYYTQLLGFSLGISPEKLGIPFNVSSADMVLT